MKQAIRYWTLIVGLVLLASVVLAACSSGGGGDLSAAPKTGAALAPTSEAPAPATTDDGVIHVSAPANSMVDGFAETQISAPADSAFTIHFANDDEGIPHNIQIFKGTDTAVDPVWEPKNDASITGPAEVDYKISALSAGTYTYNCYVHPTTMVGTLTVA